MGFECDPRSNPDHGVEQVCQQHKIPLATPDPLDSRSIFRDPCFLTYFRSVDRRPPLLVKFSGCERVFIARNTALTERINCCLYTTTLGSLPWRRRPGAIALMRELDLHLINELPAVGGLVIRQPDCQKIQDSQTATAARLPRRPDSQVCQWYQISNMIRVR